MSANLQLITFPEKWDDDNIKALADEDPKRAFKIL